MWTFLTVIGGGISFFLAAVVGNSIAAAWQRRHWLAVERMNLAKISYESKVNLTQSIFSNLDNRRLRTLNYIRVLRSARVTDVHAERDRYREAVDNWNMVIPGLTIRMKTVFSPQMAYKFDHYFPYEFYSIDSLLGRARKNLENNTLEHNKNIIDTAEFVLDLLHKRSRDFSSELLYQAQEDKNFINHKPEINVRHIDDLTYSYLLKSLFQPSSNL